MAAPTAKPAAEPSPVSGRGGATMKMKHKDERFVRNRDKIIINKQLF
jgi:hypothetical protein